MLEDTLALSNPWWHRDYEPPGRKRPYYLDQIKNTLDKNKVAILYGLRRVGKTTIIKQFIGETLGEISPTRILYASMDHPDLQHASIMDLVRMFRRINSIDTQEEHIILIDEVQHKKGFEREIKALYDLEDGLKILLSGSSSLVVKHKSAALTGRSRKILVEPLNFLEFLEFTSRSLDMSQPHKMEGFMDEYLEVGGMPEYVLDRDPQSILDVIDDIIFKDIAIEYEVRDPALLKELYYILMDRVGMSMSYSKIGRLVGIGQDAARKYTGYFKETFLLYLVERNGSPNTRVYSPKKCYIPDNGFKTVMAGRAPSGPLAENLTFLLLKELGEIRYIFEKEREVDFKCMNILVETKYKDALSDKDLLPISEISIRGVDRKMIITKSSIDISDIECVPLWKLAAFPEKFLK